MGYIIIDEEKLEERIGRWNSGDYRSKVMSDITNAQVDYSHMLKALQQAENKIDEDIRKLEEQRKNIKLLMDYAKYRI